MHTGVVEILRKLNLSPTAAKTYLALLHLGKSSAGKIARNAGTYKANTYDALDRLMEAGLATHVREGKKKLYLPTHPAKLMTSVEEAQQKTEQTYEELKKDLTRLLPKLSATYDTLEKDLVEVYRGKKGYRALIQDILREKPRQWKGFGNLQVQAHFPYDFPHWFNQVKIQLFSTKSQEVLQRIGEARKTTSVEITWLPQELYMPVVWTLFGNNLLILLYEPDLIAVRIQSEPVVKTFQNQFDYLWKKHMKKSNISLPKKSLKTSQAQNP